jgi:hypothetical protein
MKVQIYSDKQIFPLGYMTKQAGANLQSSVKFTANTIHKETLFVTGYVIVCLIFGDPLPQGVDSLGVFFTEKTKSS